MSIEFDSLNLIANQNCSLNTRIYLSRLRFTNATIPSFKELTKVKEENCAWRAKESMHSRGVCLS